MKSFWYSAINLAAVLSALWIVLSGMFDTKLLVLGLVSVIFVTYLSLRMGVADHKGDAIHMHIRLLRYYLYWIWLIGEIIKSSIDVCRRVLDPKCQISPIMVQIRGSQKTDVGRVNYANSITRTPGTVTIDVQKNYFLVHALTGEIAASLQAGEMDRRVSTLEDM
uniref:Multisubunit sodium/proton antiporter, MrpE subunit n=1 Tax=Candidatus Kentrum eta TaxID=2126337 RepID=A0A450VKE9_9GAMM|nr:MAG: multisubunit sodium/proton antiporter, MrpE subunit [Candidatus Kentron sp. H]VFK05296.1 MAG: multisubunit sodium/proton antiporter, MrpE subunit [Candidatus Kentron sp. H]VFK08539.1 MAG: multisubunit sodium/proton antiporter, MrpE subunit [Candidatus Kentron sp. H]